MKRAARNSKPYIVSKILVLTITSNLEFSQQCKKAAGKDNRMLGFIKRNFSFKNKDIILSIYNRQHLEYAVQFWSPLT